MTAAIANRGYFYTPHVIKEIEGDSIPSRFNEKHFTGIDAEHFEPIVHGMYLAVNGEAGATARIARIPGIEVCGKTGTAQNPHGKDHAIFIAFAQRAPRLLLQYMLKMPASASTAANSKSDDRKISEKVLILPQMAGGQNTKSESDK